MSPDFRFVHWFVAPWILRYLCRAAPKLAGSQHSVRARQMASQWPVCVTINCSLAIRGVTCEVCEWKARGSLVHDAVDLLTARKKKVTGALSYHLFLAFLSVSFSFLLRHS